MSLEAKIEELSLNVVNLTAAIGLLLNSKAEDTNLKPGKSRKTAPVTVDNETGQVSQTSSPASAAASASPASSTEETPQAAAPAAEKTSQTSAPAETGEQVDTSDEALRQRATDVARTSEAAKASVKKLLAELGVEKVSEVPKAKRVAFLEELAAI